MIVNTRDGVICAESTSGIKELMSTMQKVLRPQFAKDNGLPLGPWIRIEFSIEEDGMTMLNPRWDLVPVPTKVVEEKAVSTEVTSVNIPEAFLGLLEMAERGDILAKDVVLGTPWDSLVCAFQELGCNEERKDYYDRVEALRKVFNPTKVVEEKAVARPLQPHVFRCDYREDGSAISFVSNLLDAEGEGDGSPTTGEERVCAWIEDSYELAEKFGGEYLGNMAEPRAFDPSVAKTYTVMARSKEEAIALLVHRALAVKEKAA